MTRKTCIVCTIGPASEGEEQLRELITEGMNVARINFSHCPYDEAIARLEKIHRIRAELNVPLATMLDTKGPEVRIHGFSEHLHLVRGELLRIDSDPELLQKKPTHKNQIFTNLPDVGKLCATGATVLLQDGFVECTVIDAVHDGSSYIVVRVENSSEIRSKAHMSIPGVDYPIPFLSQKDIADIEFAVQQRFEYIALSFVRTAKDVEQVRRIVKAADATWPIRLIAKIEDRKALNNLDEIISVADGIMVARGDLGVEVPIEMLPVLQKRIIEKCYRAGKPVIVATQMLESMTEKAYPTRAEVSDVANAVHDSTSAVMLSGETAHGVHPAKVTSMMRRIIMETEATIDYKEKVRTNRMHLESHDLTNVMSYNAIVTAHQCEAAAILVITTAGYSARSISKFRPSVPIHAFTFSDTVKHQLALAWGVQSHKLNGSDKSWNAVLQETLAICEQQNIAKDGEYVVIVAGLPFGEANAVNTIRVETMRIPKGTSKASHLGQIINQVSEVPLEVLG